MDNENGETMTVEAIEWPFLKAQKEGGDPAVSGAGPSHVVEDDNGSNPNDRYDKLEAILLRNHTKIFPKERVTFDKYKHTLNE